MEDKITPPEAGIRIVTTLIDYGHEACFVGGCVRDSLLGRIPCDWDIATSATPEQVSEALKDYTLLPTGVSHGTLTVLAGKESFEITTFRVDGAYSDSRRPDSVAFTASLRDDLARRDFTMNALAWHPERGVVDYFGGRKDLAEGLIRCVGDARERFSEDALRILRCARFAATLGFEIERETGEAMLSLCGKLSAVSRERVQAELCKAIMGDRFCEVFLRYPEVLLECLPELRPSLGFAQNSRYHCYDVYEHTLRAVQSAPPELTVRVALLLHDVGKPRCYTQDPDGMGHFKGHPRASREIAEAALARLRFSSEATRQILELVLYHNATIPPEPGPVKRWLGKLGPELLGKLVAVKRADAEAHEISAAQARLRQVAALEGEIERVLSAGECFRVSMLAVGGEDLLRLGMAPGKEIGELLRKLTERVVDGELPNDRDALLRAAREAVSAENRGEPTGSGEV